MASSMLDCAALKIWVFDGQELLPIARSRHGFGPAARPDSLLIFGRRGDGGTVIVGSAEARCVGGGRGRLAPSSCRAFRGQLRQRHSLAGELRARWPGRGQAAGRRMALAAPRGAGRPDPEPAGRAADAHPGGKCVLCWPSAALPPAKVACCASSGATALRKKNTIYTAEQQQRSDVRAESEDWFEAQDEFDPDTLIFLDSRVRLWRMSRRRRALA
ncbi:hypothetical protein MSPGM_37000 [Methylorubrum sp. GM97]|nr:hypothetical protein MSPGM_37000 [Methylorubrum sp. GM97]